MRSHIRGSRQKTAYPHPSSGTFEILCKHHSAVGGSIVETCERGGRGRRRGGGGDGNLDLVARNGAFVWRHSVRRSIYQPVLTLEKAHEKGCKTRQRMKQNVLSSAGFSGNPIKPVFRSAINPFCLPASLGLHFLSPIHQRMTLNRPPPLPPSIQPSREGGLKSRSSGCFSDAPGESWTGP